MGWGQVIERRCGQVVILDLTYNFAPYESESVLSNRVRVLLQHGWLKILLNLARVSHIDSYGLSELLRSRSLVMERGGRLGLFHIEPPIQRLMARTRTLMFEVFESEDDAVISLTDQDARAR
jgi:anti-anti-sigma factor